MRLLEGEGKNKTWETRHRGAERPGWDVPAPSRSWRETERCQGEPLLRGAPQRFPQANNSESAPSGRWVGRSPPGEVGKWATCSRRPACTLTPLAESGAHTNGLDACRPPGRAPRRVPGRQQSLGAAGPRPCGILTVLANSFTVSHQ